MCCDEEPPELFFGLVFCFLGLEAISMSAPGSEVEIGDSRLKAIRSRLDDLGGREWASWGT